LLTSARRQAWTPIWSGAVWKMRGFARRLPDRFLFSKRGSPFWRGGSESAHLINTARSRSAVHACRRAEVSIALERVKAAGARGNQNTRVPSPGHQFSADNFIDQPHLYWLPPLDDLPREQEVRGLFSPICRVRNTDRLPARIRSSLPCSQIRSGDRQTWKSQSVAMPQPPASAAPFTAAISGFEKTPDAPEHFAFAAIFLVFRGRLASRAREHFQVHPRAERFSASRRISHARMALFIASSADCSYGDHRCRDGVSFVGGSA